MYLGTLRLCSKCLFYFIFVLFCMFPACWFLTYDTVFAFQRCFCHTALDLCLSGSIRTLTSTSVTHFSGLRFFMFLFPCGHWQLSPQLTPCDTQFFPGASQVPLPPSWTLNKIKHMYISPKLFIIYIYTSVYIYNKKLGTKTCSIPNV